MFRQRAGVPDERDEVLEEPGPDTVPVVGWPASEPSRAQARNWYSRVRAGIARALAICTSTGNGGSSGHHSASSMLSNGALRDLVVGERARVVLSEPVIVFTHPRIMLRSTG